MKKNLIFVFFLFHLSCTYADWKVEKNKTFKGEIVTYLVNNSRDGGEIWIDLQQKFIVFRKKNNTLNGIKGIKIDGEYFDINVSHTSGDSFDTFVFCSEEYNQKCYKKIFSAKIVEVNVDYFRRGEIVSKFTINATKENEKKFYENGCLPNPYMSGDEDLTNSQNEKSKADSDKKICYD